VKSQDDASWERFQNLTDEQIRRGIKQDPDAAPELDEHFWKRAKLVWPRKKLSMTVRLDPDILVWFRSFGKGYQTRMNAVLRSYMHAHRK